MMRNDKAARAYARCTGLSIVLMLIVLRATAAAQATGDITAAADAFSRAQQAELRGEYAEAAQLYALADRIAPAREALRSAAAAAHRAGMDATAATYAAELLERDALDADSRAVAEEILRDAEPRLARIVATCAPTCRLLVDGRVVTRNASDEHIVYVRPGQRRISATFDGGQRVDQPPMDLGAGQRVEVELEPPPSASAARSGSDRGRGTSPWIFGVSAGLTTVAAGLTIWSGMRVVNAHDAYDRTAVDARARYDEGRQLERRTNALIGVTAGLAATTLVFGLVTNFHGEHATASSARVRGTPTLAADRAGIAVGFVATF